MPTNHGRLSAGLMKITRGTPSQPILRCGRRREATGAPSVRSTVVHAAPASDPGTPLRANLDSADCDHALWRGCGRCRVRRCSAVTPGGSGGEQRDERDGPAVIVRDLHREGPVRPLEDVHYGADGARNQPFVVQGIDVRDSFQALHECQISDPLRHRVLMFAFWSPVRNISALHYRYGDEWRERNTQLARRTPGKLPDPRPPDLLIQCRRSALIDALDFIHGRFWDVVGKPLPVDHRRWNSSTER
jgi:hypothetical protein